MEESKFMLLVVVIVFIGVIYYLVRKFEINDTEHQEKNMVSNRITISSLMYVYPPKSDEDEDDNDTGGITDPTLLKLMGNDKQVKQNYKTYSIRVDIPVEEVFIFSEWTTNGYDEIITNNATRIVFYDGTEMISTMPYDLFKEMYDERN
jgi:hypothetical protein